MDAQRRRRSVVRAVVVAVGLVVWLAVGGVGGPFVGKLSEVQTNDNASFLPKSAESTEVNELSARFRTSESVPYILVAERASGVTAEDRAAFADVAARVSTLQLVKDRTLSEVLVPGPVVTVPSQDGKALLAVVSLKADAADDVVAEGETALYATAESLRDALSAAAPAGLATHVTGPGGIFADFVIAFAGIDGKLLGVALGAVLLILLLVYRSPVLPLAVLLTSGFGLGVAGAVVYALAKNDVIGLNGQSQGILSILVVGAATDYSLLLVARYREELHDHEDRFVAMRRAWKAALEPIAASAATVVLGLLCLLLSELGSNRGLGPIGAIGIVGAFLAAMTFLPLLLLVPSVLLWLIVLAVPVALAAAFGGPAPLVGGVAVAAVALLVVLAVLRGKALRGRASGRRTTVPWFARPLAGRWLFWPRIPRTDHVHGEDVVGTRSLWGRVAGLVEHRPRVVWLVTAAVLAGLAAFAPTLDTAGVSQTETFRDRVDSVVGQEVVAKHFPAGSGSPVLVITPVAKLERTAEAAKGVSGVEAVTVTPEQPVTGPPTAGAPAPSPKVVDGRAEVEVTLQPAADSPEGEAVVRTLRASLDRVGTDVLVGGSTAINLDVRDASDRDLKVIIPVVLLVIFVVLALLLRSLLAPLLLILANVLSFAATIGTAALVFNHVLDLPGGDPATPLFGFVFLVALGIDYSIFLMTRVREESGRRGTRTGIVVGLAVTGGVITSAGVVLAATFGALGTLPILFLLQIAFIVSFGVLLDTLVVRSLLVPALSYDVGRRIWWPHRLSRQADAAD